MKKRLLALLLTIVVALSVCAVPAAAAESSNDENTYPTSGTCGENITWYFDAASGMLIISGTGAMSTGAVSPWFRFADQITSVVIGEGITSMTGFVSPELHNVESVLLPSTLEELPTNAFLFCRSLKELKIPENVSVIGMYSFSHCENLTELIIPASVKTIFMCGLGAIPNISKIIFVGDAPEFGEYAFTETETTVYYPANNATWTEDVRQNYGGNITWVPIPDGCTHSYDDNVDGICNGCGAHREEVEYRIVVHMHRMYNPNSGEHFYTGDTVERDDLIAAGWQYEGVGFTFPANTGVPVHRLYHKPTGEHLYTMDEAEKDRLLAEGWNYEGVAFNSAYDTEAAQHRLHNPNATVGAYHFTFSVEEMQNLIEAGWEYQGIGWYSCWK